MKISVMSWKMLFRCTFSPYWGDFHKNIGLGRFQSGEGSTLGVANMIFQVGWLKKLLQKWEKS